MVDALLSMVSWGPIILGMARGIGLVLLLPLGWEVIGISQRLALAAGFALGAPIEGLDAPNVSLAALAFSHGMMLGLPIALATDVAASIGELLDSGRGMMMAELMDPLAAQSTSHLALLMRQSSWICFLTIGGMPMLVRALKDDYVGRGVTAAFQSSLHGLGLMVESAVTMVAPAFALFLVCELVVVVIARASANISLSLEGTILRVIVSLSVLLAIITNLEELSRLALPSAEISAGTSFNPVAK